MKLEELRARLQLDACACCLDPVDDESELYTRPLHKPVCMWCAEMCYDLLAGRYHHDQDVEGRRTPLPTDPGVKVVRFLPTREALRAAVQCKACRRIRFAHRDKVKQVYLIEPCEWAAATTSRRRSRAQRTHAFAATSARPACSGTRCTARCACGVTRVATT